MRLLACLPLLLLVPGAALARPAVTLDSQIFVERISTDLNGRERRTLMTPQRIGTGDRLVFVVRYRNDGAAPVDGVAVTNPVPATLRIDTDHPGMQVSVDGGRNWGKLSTMTMPSGIGGIRRATADDVTHVRWPLAAAIQPGGGGRISYRATVR